MKATKSVKAINMKATEVMKKATGAMKKATEVMKKIQIISLDNFHQCLNLINLIETYYCQAKNPPQGIRSNLQSKPVDDEFTEKLKEATSSQTMKSFSLIFSSVADICILVSKFGGSKTEKLI